ncbi:hypothetical protein ABZV77_22955 [Streptomyces sp. NPDC004732]|uniref:hypothetical protein n=1 Tax=Streptomyces sp. NPDC004732 TaxID=3154290 RepID=UPI0033ADFC13
MGRTSDQNPTPSHEGDVASGKPDDGASVAVTSARSADKHRDVARIFRDIDTFAPDAFVAHLTEDVVFRFANSPELVGRHEVRQGVAASASAR